MLDWVLRYKVDILVVVVVAIIVYVATQLLGKYDKTGKIRKIVADVCIEIEKYMGSGNGKLKKDLAINWLLHRYKILGILFTKESLGDLIDNVVAYINKEKLTDNRAFTDVDTTVINIKDIPLK